MSDIAVMVEGLGKRYRLGQQVGYKTLRETVLVAYHTPTRLLAQRVRRLRQPQASVQSPSRPRAPVPSDSDHIWALKDISFEVKRGEAVGIIGRNGSGKSTLLKILSRITAPTEGRAEIRGRVGSLLEVGTGFHPELSGRENIYLNGAIIGMKKAEIDRKFSDIVEFAEIEKFLDTPVKRYSSGMYVRLAFSVAAHLEPDILLVDEVLAVGDVQFQKKCLGKMGSVTREGRTVLFVSHNMAAVRNLCSHAALLVSGKVRTCGATEAVVDEYLIDGASTKSAVVALPPGTGDAPGQGTSLRFYNGNGEPTAQFHLGEPWRVRLEFAVNRPVDNLIAAIGIVTIYGTPVITYWSKARTLGVGRYYVDFDCDLPLEAGDIQIAVGLSGNEHSFYHSEGHGHVSISELALGDQPHRSSGTGVLVGMRRPDIRSVGDLANFETLDTT